MKKIVLVTLAIVCVVLGTGSLGASANASQINQSPPPQGFGWG